MAVIAVWVVVISGCHRGAGSSDGSSHPAAAELGLAAVAPRPSAAATELATAAALS
jgi:hypothetical protein